MSYLVNNVRGEEELGLEGHADVGRRRVGEEGGVARDPGGEAGLVQADALLADGAPPPVRTEAEEPCPGLWLTNTGAAMQTGVS